MADTGGGSQLIVAQAPDTKATTGTVTWWDLRDGAWVRAGSAPARFGAGGLVDGDTRVQGTDTTPTGLYDLPFAFGIEPAPAGTAVEYRAVRESSWWCQDNDSRSYNRWVDPCPPTAAPPSPSTSSTSGSSTPTPWSSASTTTGRYGGAGAGIFLHVNGQGATAGCVSVPEDDMRRILRWAEPGRKPHIAVGTAGGGTAVTRY